MPPTSTVYDRIRLLQNTGSFELAIQAAEAALEDAPHDARLWELLGIACHGLRDFMEATDALERASLLAPLSPAGQVALAGCYLVTDHHEVARTMYQHLVFQRSRVPVSLLPMVASGLSRLGEPYQALEVHRERVRREPEDDNAVYAVAHTMQILQYPAEVVRPIARRAFELAPDRLRNRVALALLHYQCSDLADAYDLLTSIEISELVSGRCPCRLQGLTELFEIVGDEERRDACQTRLDELAERRRQSAEQQREDQQGG